MNKKNIIWNKIPNSIEEKNNIYYTNKFKNNKKPKVKNDLKIKNNKLLNKNKILKQKKNSFFEFKKNRFEKKLTWNNYKNKKKLNFLKHSFKKPVQIVNRNVIIGETITVAELANKMAVKASQVIKEIMKLGEMVTINQALDQETAQLIAEEMGHKVIIKHENQLENYVISDRDIGNFNAATLRAPIVTIMGHVDHGKTSLLDYIRSTKVTSSEVGGITQRIGAYHVKTDNGMITFIDTPGHAAFTAMRARGANITDIVVLVVAADDGVMPQTIEAIKHAKAAKVPILVAVNKIDKKILDKNKIKNELNNYGIVPEEWGGKNQFIYVSAKSGEGVNKLLDSIILQSEILELKSIHNGMASGVIIESYLDKGLGPVATILVREGTLNKGDIVLSGLEYGKIRSMINELGHNIISAGPSIPVKIFGLSGIPVVGDKLIVVRNEKNAREVALYRQGKFREIKLKNYKKKKIDNLFSTINNSKSSEFNIVLKSDLQGSSEAICDTLKNLSNKNIKINIVYSGVGDVTESDATLAIASKAILVCFNVKTNVFARKIIESENLNIFYYKIIYDLINSVKKFLDGMLIPKYKKNIIGLAEVRNIFNLPKFNIIAGCMIKEGIVKKNDKINLLRKNKLIYEGKIESLRRFKENVNEVSSGMECGISIKNYNDIRSGDIIEVFEKIKI